MLDASVGGVILDGLFGLRGKELVRFPGEVYIGLLTRMPNPNGAAYEDGKYFDEPADPTYLRLRLDATSRIKKVLFIGGAQLGEVVDIDGDKAVPAYVQNDDLLIFPEASEPYNVVGFGLFRTADKSSKTLPFLWGEVAAVDGSPTISVAAEEVPIIREGDFRVYLV